MPYSVMTLKESNKKESSLIKKQEREIEKLKERVKALSVKNTKLSERNNVLVWKHSAMSRTVASLNSKKERAVSLVTKLWFDGFLSLSKQQVADRLFVDIAYIDNEHRALKRAIK